MNSLVLLVIIVAAFALVYWGLTKMTLPPNVMVVITVIMGLIALGFIYNIFVGGSGFHFGVIH